MVVVIEADGGVGACLWVTGEPVAGGIPVKPSRATPGLVDRLHDATFGIWCDGERVGGVFIGEVSHGVSPPVFSFGGSCCCACLRILIVARCCMCPLL